MRLRACLFRDRVEREIEEELRWHLHMETEKNMREGMSRQAARPEAYRRFGGVERTRDMHRDVRSMRQVERILYDVRYAFGGLVRSRSFAAAGHDFQLEGIVKAGLFVGDVERLRAHLADRGVEVDSRIGTDGLTGWRFFVFRDAYGNRIQAFERGH